MPIRRLLIPMELINPETASGDLLLRLSARRKFRGNAADPRQRGKWVTADLAIHRFVPCGVGGGVAYHSPSGAWHVLIGYGHGFNPPRHEEQGANSLALLVQYDFRKNKTNFQNMWRNLSPTFWRGITK